MKKFLKVLTSTTLIIAMVLTGLPALPEIDFENLKLDFSNIFSGITEAYAGSSSGSEAEVDRTAYKATNVVGTENASPNAGRQATSKDTYILSATMNYGVTSDTCKYVIIKYYASADAKSKGIVSTQFLSVNAGNDLGEDIANTSTFVTGDNAYLGAKSVSFSPFITNTEFSNAYYGGSTGAELSSKLAYGGTTYVLNSTKLIKNFDQYNIWAKTATGADVSANYPSAQEKAQSSAFQPASTEYIRFRFEYGFFELVDLAFYCEYDGEGAGGVFAFAVRSWTLYKHDGEFDDSNYLRSGETTATNYAFVSNSLSLAFNGTRLYESVSYDPDDPTTYDYTDTYDMQGQGGCTFTFVNADDYEEYEDYVTGFSNIYFFKKCTGTDAELHVSADNKTILNFGINFSDTFGSGIDEYMSAANFNECLYAEITFLDTHNIQQVVTLPVMTNALLEFAIPVDEDPYEKNDEFTSSADTAYRLDNISRGEYLSFAHESDTIYFSVEFPDFKALSDVKLKYRPLVATDHIVISGIDVYDNNGVSQYAVRNLYQDNSVDGSAIDMKLMGPKRVYTTTADSRDIRLDETFKEYDFEMTAVSGDAAEEEIWGDRYKDKYLISITTANDDQCATSDQVCIVLKYKDWNGKAQTAPITNIFEASRDFNGSNRAVITTKKADGTSSDLVSYDGAYYYGMSAGQTIQFYITAKNVEEFTELSFEWANDDEKGDFWQISHVKIEKLQNETQIGKLLCAKVDKTISLAKHDSSTRTVKINQIFGRNISGLKTLYDSDVDYALSLEGTEVLNLENGETNFDPTGDSTSTEKKEQYKYSLSSGLSAQDLGLGTASVTYQVQVDVAGNSDALRNDDCGSNNKFYFQLTFASFGQAMTRSAYVLANQQLTADGFRAGYTECFTISLNEQVGDVTGINIIIDDISADAATQDKLNIKDITIVKQNKSDIDECWVIENVGWIGPEYVDDDEAYERDTRSETDIITKLPVSYSSYMLELEFALTWGAYDSVDAIGSDVIQPDDLTTFVGNLLADVSYTVSGENGGRGILSSQQCVQLMADYTGQTAVSDDDITFVSDPSYMFRSGHTNRFIMTFKKASAINSIKFTGYASSQSSVNYIPLSSMSVAIVLSAGAPRVDVDSGDFFRKYNEDPIPYCDTFSPNINNYKLAAQASKESGAYSTTFKFKDCTDISSLAESKKISSVVTREPASANDMMNVYLYLSPETKSPKEDNYSLDVRVYTGQSNSQYTLCTKLENMKEDKAIDLNGQEVVRVYKESIDAPYMQSLKNLNVRSMDIVAGGDHHKQANYAVQYAVVQQVRDGVVINTYKVNFTPQHFGSTEYGASMGGAYTSKQLGAKQLVTLQLGDGSMTAELVAEQYDIAVAIRYRSNVSGDRDLLSPYVFATDKGVETVHAGSILEFEFYEAYVGSIEGISVYAMNGLEATLSAATIKTYETVDSISTTGKKTSDLQQTCIYSIIAEDTSTDKNEQTKNLASATISSAITNFDVLGSGDTTGKNPQTLKRANFSFTVMSDEVAGMIDSGGKNPIRATIGYKITPQNSGSDTRTLQVADLRQYSVDGTEFTSGSTVNVSMFLQGAVGLSYVELEPYDDSESSTASLNLNNVSFQLDDVDDTSTRTMCFGGTIYEGSPAKVNLSSIVVELDVEYMIPSYGKATGKVKNDTLAIVAEEGTDVVITPTITDSNQGYAVRIYRLIGENRQLMEKQAYGDGEVFTFPAYNGTSETVEWLIEISASEVPISDTNQNSSQGVKSYVKITVPAEGESPQVNTGGSNTGSDTGSNTSN